MFSITKFYGSRVSYDEKNSVCNSVIRQNKLRKRHVCWMHYKRIFFQSLFQSISVSSSLVVYVFKSMTVIWSLVLFTCEMIIPKEKSIWPICLVGCRYQFDHCDCHAHWSSDTTDVTEMGKNRDSFSVWDNQKAVLIK